MAFVLKSGFQSVLGVVSSVGLKGTSSRLGWHCKDQKQKRDFPKDLNCIRHFPVNETTLSCENL